ncbi:MAG: hypothetical protein U1F59_02890 [Candidatus Competibacteraceae bacterium]
MPPLPARPHALRLAGSGLTAGNRLDFSIGHDNGELRAYPVATTALGLAGLRRRPGQLFYNIQLVKDYGMVSDGAGSRLGRYPFIPSMIPAM